MDTVTEPIETQSRAAAAVAECRLLAGFTEEPGRTTRRYLTPPVAEVHAHLRNRMEALHMTVTTDAAGNLRGLWQPTAARPGRLVIGSHIDTVPDAGAFDGVLGVILALHLVEQAQASNLSLAIEVIAFSEEEGVRFGVPFLGSRAVAGRFNPALLELTDFAGVSMETAIRGFGLNPEDLSDAQLAEDAFGFFEIHIEQGPVLDAEKLPLAVVTAIVGQTRCEIVFSGQANHAGTTPMHLRRDPLTAAAEWIAAVEEFAVQHPQNVVPGQGLVATVGKLIVEPNAGNVIAGTVRAALDVRCAYDQARQEAVVALLDRAQAIAIRRGSGCEVYRQIDQPAVSMDEELTALLADAVEAIGLSVRRMPSGAGHDAMVMATRVPSAMLFLRSPAGISHHPAEAVLEQDIAMALKVGKVFLRRLADHVSH